MMSIQIRRHVFHNLRQLRSGYDITRTLATAADKKNVLQKKELPELDMSDFGEASGLEEADIHIDGNEVRPSRSPEGKYVGVLDIDNPPKLTHEHYKMLKGIDFTGRLQFRKEQKEEEEEEWKKKINAMRTRTDARFQFDLKELLSLKPDQLKKENEEKITPWTPTQEIIDEYDYQLTEKDPLEETLRKLNQMKEKEEQFEPIRKKKNCIFCQPDPSRKSVKTIDYTNVQLLHQFINERGMIKNRRFTNNCMKHQKDIQLSIKRARQIGLLPFISNWSPVHPSESEDYGDVISDRWDETFGAFETAVDFDAPDFKKRASKPYTDEEKKLEKQRKEIQRELRGATRKRKQRNPKDIPGELERREYITNLESSDDYSNRNVQNKAKTKKKEFEEMVQREIHEEQNRKQEIYKEEDLDIHEQDKNIGENREPSRTIR